MSTDKPQGVAFYNIKTGETHYLRLEAQIQGYINSSDMGVNASRGQDFGWRLAPDWVRKVRDYRNDEDKMERLITKNGGRRPSTPQILYEIYGAQVRQYEQKLEDDENPYEDEYLNQISSTPRQAQVDAPEYDEPVELEEPIN